MDKFNHNIIEQDIKRLSHEIAEKKKLLKYKELPEKELIKQALESLVKQPYIQSAQQLAQSRKPTKKTFLPDYLKNSPDEIKLQVEKLVDLVFHRGVLKTIKEAQKAGPFILDAFHDALTDKLYDELKKRKYL